jgi:hypothetical protein
MTGPFEFELSQETAEQIEQLARIYDVPVGLIDPHYWHPAAEDVISDELVRCTLGQSRRPELNVTPAERMERLARSVDELKAAVADALRPAALKGIIALNHFAKAFERKDR